MILVGRRWLLRAAIGLVLAGVGLAAFDPVHLGLAWLTVGLFLPAALLADWLDRQAARGGPAGSVIGMAAGLVIRGTAAVGGGCAVFFGTSLYRERPLTFWSWVVVGYVAFLVAGVASQIDAGRRAGG